MSFGRGHFSTRLGRAGLGARGNSSERERYVRRPSRELPRTELPTHTARAPVQPPPSARCRPVSSSPCRAPSGRRPTGPKPSPLGSAILRRSHRLATGPARSLLRRPFAGPVRREGRSRTAPSRPGGCRRLCARPFAPCAWGLRFGSGIHASLSSWPDRPTGSWASDLDGRRARKTPRQADLFPRAGQAPHSSRCK